MQLKSGIYKITNVVNFKFYIGSSMNINVRRMAHFNTLKRNVHKNIYLQRAYNKHGKENFIFEQIATCPKEYLIKLEQWFIDNLKPDYNLLKTAGNAKGYKHSDANKLKLSIIKKKNYNSENQIRLYEGFKLYIKNKQSKYKIVANLISNNLTKKQICSQLNMTDSQFRLLKNQASNKGLLKKHQCKKSMFIELFKMDTPKDVIIDKLNMNPRTYRSYKCNYLKKLKNELYNNI